LTGGHPDWPALDRRAFVENIKGSMHTLAPAVKSTGSAYCVTVDTRSGVASVVPEGRGPDGRLREIGCHSVNIQGARLEPGTGGGAGRVVYSSEQDAVDGRIRTAWERYRDYRVRVLGEPAP